MERLKEFISSKKPHVIAICAINRFVEEVISLSHIYSRAFAKKKSDKFILRMLAFQRCHSSGTGCTKHCERVRTRRTAPCNQRRTCGQRTLYGVHAL